MDKCPLRVGESWNADLPDECVIRCLNPALATATPEDMKQPLSLQEIAADYPDRSVEDMDGHVNQGLHRIQGSNVRRVIEEVGKDPLGLGDQGALALTNVTELDWTCLHD